MKRYLGCVLAAPIVLWATIVSAQVAPETAPPVEAAVPVILPSPVAASPSETVPAALTLEELGQESGRQGVYIYANTTQALSAANSGNTINADHVGSGNISLTEGAFAGFAGIGNFVINSGHNNNLQGSLSIMLVTP